MSLKLWPPKFKSRQWLWIFNLYWCQMWLKCQAFKQRKPSSTRVALRVTVHFKCCLPVCRKRADSALSFLVTSLNISNCSWTFCPVLVFAVYPLQMHWFIVLIVIILTSWHYPSSEIVTLYQKIFMWAAPDAQYLLHDNTKTYQGFHTIVLICCASKYLSCLRRAA